MACVLCKNAHRKAKVKVTSLDENLVFDAEWCEALGVWFVTHQNSDYSSPNLPYSKEDVEEVFVAS